MAGHASAGVKWLQLAQRREHGEAGSGALASDVWLVPWSGACCHVTQLHTLDRESSSWQGYRVRYKGGRQETGRGQIDLAGFRLWVAMQQHACCDTGSRATRSNFGFRIQGYGSVAWG